MGPVCSFLSKVNEMPYNPRIRALPGGEEIIMLTDNVVDKMKSGQRTYYKIVKAGFRFI